MVSREPGWYPDSEDATLLRFWDGSNWTDPVAPRLVDPEAAAESDTPITRTGVPPAAVLVMGVLSIFLAFTLIVPIAAIYLGRRYENELKANENGSWMAPVGVALAVFSLGILVLGYFLFAG